MSQTISFYYLGDYGYDDEADYAGYDGVGFGGDYWANDVIDYYGTNYGVDYYATTLGEYTRTHTHTHNNNNKY